MRRRSRLPWHSEETVVMVHALPNQPGRGLSVFGLSPSLPYRFRVLWHKGGTNTIVVDLIIPLDPLPSLSPMERGSLARTINQAMARVADAMDPPLPVAKFGRRVVLWEEA